MGLDEPADDAGRGDARDVLLVVRVVRTGGFAGLRREWKAEPPPDEAPRWIGLIDECPWEAAASPAPARGADTFQWRISARCADDPPRSAALSDDQLRGPWRDLVDEVRAYGAPDEPRRRPSGRTGSSS
ncbi:protealysin inhibitor emfourin [Microbacterium ulmi]|uniref:Uncharacterized protein n=1 Tax=Microbacterium ulmi TaxID=179095 RepID=A0A7Y2M0W5_9MICO|nr:protealysin inhibitor emfourin [Microbacterium ulmi]NII70451.1 hypothetical protein [Microbacterium ulmi]NNH04440.1 hypothetical protein [Microbacterium ulmi]